VSEADDWYWERNWNDYRQGSTSVRLSWEGGGADAVLFDQGAPRTTEAFCRLLPLEVPMVHVAWSGEMVMSARPLPVEVTDHENRVRLVRVGDIAFDPKFGEITITYGTAEATLPDGPNVLTVFGHVTSDHDDLASFGRRRRFEGIGSVRFEIVPPTQRRSR
jgi:hypothetical protein